MSKKLSLYNITQEISALEEMLCDDKGEICEASEQLENHVESILIQKVDGCVEFTKYLESNIEAAKARMNEIKNFMDMEKRKLERFSDYVYDCLKKLGKDKIEGEYSKISIRKPSKVLLIEDESKVPSDFVSYEMIKKIDKAKLKAQLKNTEIEGIKLVDSDKKSVVFK